MNNNNGELSNDFFRHVGLSKTIGTQLSSLAKKLKNPELTTNRLSDTMDDLLKIEKINDLPEGLRNKVLGLLSKGLDRLDVSGSSSVLTDITQKLQDRGLMVDLGTSKPSAQTFEFIA